MRAIERGRKTGEAYVTKEEIMAHAKMRKKERR
jgi:hypothetical protein